MGPGRGRELAGAPPTLAAAVSGTCGLVLLKGGRWCTWQRLGRGWGDACLAGACALHLLPLASVLPPVALPPTGLFSLYHPAQVIRGTVWDEFTVAHTLGWWGKALIVRNYTML